MKCANIILKIRRNFLYVYDIDMFICSFMFMPTCKNHHNDILHFARMRNIATTDMYHPSIGVYEATDDKTCMNTYLS
jgi:hypothetical protein